MGGSLWCVRSEQPVHVGRGHEWQDGSGDGGGSTEGDESAGKFIGTQVSADGVSRRRTNVSGRRRER